MSVNLEEIHSESYPSQVWTGQLESALGNLAYIPVIRDSVQGDFPLHIYEFSSPNRVVIQTTGNTVEELNVIFGASDGFYFWYSPFIGSYTPSSSGGATAKLVSFGHPGPCEARAYDASDNLLHTFTIANGDTESTAWAIDNDWDHTILRCPNSP